MANSVVSQEHNSSLPLEIWIKIVKMLTRETALTCLSVNRLLHDIILPIVFARIVLYFGLLEADDYPPAVLHHTEDDVRRHAQELLDRIASDASFAAVIQTLQIQACPLTHKMEEERQREVRAPMVCDWIDRVSAAIPLLKNLRTFSWRGRSPPLSDVIVQQLARSCPFLERFQAFSFNMDSISLCCLKGIKTIRLTMTDRDVLALSGSKYKLFHRMLQQSTVDSSGSPYRLLDTITDLEQIFAGNDPDDNEDVLRGALRLESLSILMPDSTDQPEERMYQALFAIPSHLTSFHSLKIVPIDCRLGHIDMLCGFLIGQPQLRRLAVQSMLTATEAELFFRSIKTLVDLDTLALVFYCQESPATEWLDLLASHVPSRLSFLALGFNDKCANQGTFVEIWARLPRLRFIYVNSYFDLTVPIPDGFIRGASDTLRIVCYQECFYDVEWTADGPRVVLPPWSPYKVRSRMTEDSEYADIEWLMRYPFIDYISVIW